MDAPTRYARRNGAHLAYCLQGEGAPILFMSGTFIPMDAFEDHPLMARFIARLRGLGQLVLTDRRGIGHSDPLREEPTPEDWAEDLVAVLDHAGIDRVAVVAGFDCAYPGMALAALHPDRVERLCLLNAFADGPRLTARFEEFQRYQTALDEGFDEQSDLDVLAAVAPSVAGDERFRAWFDSAGQRGASPSTALAFTRAMFSWTAAPLAPNVSAPTLVVHRTDNQFVPVADAHELMTMLPNARLEEVPGVDQLIYVGDVDPVLDAIESFITGAVASATERTLATVLFTDLVSSTESAARLGDRRWRELLDVHDSTARRVVRRHAGEVVKSTGDGLLALFATPGAAINAAKDLQADIAALDLTMRAGVHTGEVERRGNDVGGIAVHVAARVQALAGAGEIMVSAVIPALTSGAGFAFDDMGEHQLKGVPGDWRLYRAG